MKQAHVVIIGGGFGGLSAAKVLGGKNLKVTLIDKRNYHLFQPLLYQVATAGLSPAEIAYPLRGILSGYPNVNVLLGEVQEINKEEKWLRTELNKIEFDFLILACGSTYTYFNSPQWEPFAPGLKTISQATEIRRKVFLAFEEAEREILVEKQKPHLTFVVVGGGPTGVELAGALGEITRYSITKDFRNIKPQNTRIILIEAGNRILPSMTEELSIEAMRELEQLGVQVWTNSKVTEINENGIRIGNEFIESSTILWAAGVAANPLNKTLGTPLDRQGRVIVNPDLSILLHSDIFVIGDQANFSIGDNRSLPGLAPVAMQQGRFVARNIIRKLSGKKMTERFHYIDKGQMATIGRSRAVGMFKGLEFHGFVAWMGWLLVHIYYLIGFKNRLFVLFQWAWTYLTYRRGARLIVTKE
ncbi:MAG: NAD(P)/FAD-dependent oxidoreductase [Bacteriovoracia bacterium]